MLSANTLFSGLLLSGLSGRDTPAAKHHVLQLGYRIFHCSETKEVEIGHGTGSFQSLWIANKAISERQRQQALKSGKPDDAIVPHLSCWYEFQTGSLTRFEDRSRQLPDMVWNGEPQDVGKASRSVGGFHPPAWSQIVPLPACLSS